MIHISHAIAALIEQKVSGLLKRSFDPDPLFSPHISRLVSRADSAKKRHGSIIEAVIIETVNAQPRFAAWKPGRFLISDSARSFATMQATDAGFASSDIPYTGRGKQVGIDMLVHDRRNRALIAYEIKRGLGELDAGKIRATLDSMRAVQAVLKSFGQANMIDVDRVAAYVVQYYGARSFPSPWSLTGPDLDIHFGCEITAAVGMATDYFRALIDSQDRTDRQLWENENV